jgi:glucose-fructose oxidoreductase
MTQGKANKRIRYAVVGIGSIAQEAVLPAFTNAENSELTALVSGEDEKREELGQKYGVRHTYSYDNYRQCLSSGEVDAVYIALPNHLHRTYAEQAAQAGIHILCEKPLAQSETECRNIIEASRNGGVRLMTAYRLHFEPANLDAVKTCESGKLGDLRIFHSAFCQQVAPGNVRLTNDVEHGGGPLFDMGIYCINAVRYLFRDEPVEVTAFHSSSGDARFEKCEEMMSAVLRFSKDRVASFTCSFGAATSGSYLVIGTKGTLTLDPAYEYNEDKHLIVTLDGKTDERIFKKSDQFGPELIYFSDCILNNREPEPSGEEGLVDVQIIEAIYRAANSGRAMPIEAVHRKVRPEPSQEIFRPPVGEPELVGARMPSGTTKKS